MATIRTRTMGAALRTAPPLAALLGEFVAAELGRGLRAASVDAYGRELRQLMLYLGEESTLADVTTASLTRWQAAMARQGLAPATILRRLAAARAFCRWTIRVGLRRDDPTLSIAYPRRPRLEVPKALHSDEQALLKAILEGPPPAGCRPERWERGARMVRLMLYTGARLGECTGFIWRDIDLTRQRVTIRAAIAKGGSARVLPLHPALQAELETTPLFLRLPEQPLLARRDGRAFQSKSLAHFFERDLAAAGLRIHAHQLRHTFAVELLYAGVDLVTIQRFLGHQSLETTRRYLDLDTRRDQAAMSALPAIV